MPRTSKELLQLAEADPSSAIAQAELALERLTDSWERATVFRAKGIALRTSGALAASAAAYEEGLAEAHSTGDASLIGQLELSLAPTVAYLGDMDRAIELLLTAEDRLDEAGRAQALTQRAGLVARLGDFAKSLELFAEAEPVLLRNKDVRFLANLSANRSIVHAYSGSYDAAEKDLRRARSIYVELGEGSSAAEMTHNLGFLAAQRGDIAAALTAYDEAEASYRDYGLPTHELLLDRAQALTLVGLAADASAVTGAVVKRLADIDNEVTRGEVLVAHAAASARVGDHATAIETARQAVAVLEGHGREGWRLRAEYLLAVAEFESGLSVAADRFSSLSDALERSGQTFESLHARLMAGRSALAVGDHRRASTELQRAGSLPKEAPIELRIQRALARGLLRLSQGNAGAASRSVRSGLRLLSQYRASLGATESRINVTSLAEDLLQLAAKLAFESGKPSRVLAWINQSRARAMSLVSPTPPSDPGYASALSQLRKAQAERHEAEMEGAGSPALMREQARLEERVRQIALRQPAGPATERAEVGLAGLQQRIGDREMLVYAHHEQDLFGIRIRERSIRMWNLGPAEDITREAQHLGRAMRSLALRPRRDRSEASLDSVTRSLRRLDQQLFERFNLQHRDLVIVPTPTLQSLPWTAFPTTSGRAVTTTPSPETWFHNQDAEAAEGSVLLVGGPRLDHSDEEIERLARLYPAATVLTGASATVERTLEAMRQSSVAHFACHAAFRADNAMFSSLQLADGDLTVYDIERQARAPETVVMSACESGLSQNTAGEELTGLASALISLGTRSLVVSVAPVPDATPTIDLMDRLHTRLSVGAPAPGALAEARSEDQDESVAARLARDVFLCVG